MPTTRFLSHIVSVLLLVTCICVAQDELKNQPTVWATSPTSLPSTRWRTARLAGCAEIRSTSFSPSKDARTIDNTLVPYDEAVRQLNTASYFAGCSRSFIPTQSTATLPRR